MKDEACRICGARLKEQERIGGACGGDHRRILNSYGYYGKGGKEYLTPKGIEKVKALGLPTEHLLEP